MNKDKKKTWPSVSSGVLTAAYGRNYVSRESILADFRQGKDFRVNWPGGSTYCSIRDCQPGEMVKFRFNGNREACFYSVTDRDFNQPERPSLTVVKK